MWLHNAWFFLSALKSCMIGKPTMYLKYYIISDIIACACGPSRYMCVCVLHHFKIAVHAFDNITILSTISEIRTGILLLVSQTTKPLRRQYYPYIYRGSWIVITMCVSLCVYVIFQKAHRCLSWTYVWSLCVLYIFTDTVVFISNKQTKRHKELIFSESCAHMCFVL